MNALTPTSVALKSCPKCRKDFAPKRKNQKFCSRTCQKNNSRVSRISENDEMNALHYEKAMTLVSMVYDAQPYERLGVMKDILSFVPVDANLRRVLSDPKLLRAHPSRAPELFYVRGDCTFPQVANRYTKKFFGLPIQAYVREVIRNGEVGVIEVAETQIDHGPVPRINTKLTRGNVKCWHKPLKSTTRATEEETTQHNRVVDEVLARVAPVPDDYDRHERARIEAELDEKVRQSLCGSQNPKEAKRKLGLSQESFDQKVELTGQWAKGRALELGIQSL